MHPVSATVITTAGLRGMWTNTVSILALLTSSEDSYSQIQSNLSKLPPLEGCRVRPYQVNPWCSLCLTICIASLNQAVTHLIVRYLTKNKFMFTQDRWGLTEALFQILQLADTGDYPCALGLDGTPTWPTASKSLVGGHGLCPKKKNLSTGSPHSPLSFSGKRGASGLPKLLLWILRALEVQAGFHLRYAVVMGPLLDRGFTPVTAAACGWTMKKSNAVSAWNSIPPGCICLF